jgi:hypothetical protein
VTPSIEKRFGRLESALTTVETHGMNVVFDFDYEGQSLEGGVYFACQTSLKASRVCISHFEDLCFH